MTHPITGLSAVDFTLGAVTTVIGCVAVVALPNEPNGGMALLVATTGMITALGAVTTSLVRIWAEHRRSDREETSRRHELIARLAELKHAIDMNRVRLDELETTVERLQREHPRDPKD